MNPEPFLNLDRVIHEKGRLAIMSALAATEKLSFADLRDLLQMTDGNVTSHLRTLHESGYVAFTKSMEGARPLTTYSITDKGRRVFTDYIHLLDQIVRQTKGS